MRRLELTRGYSCCFVLVTLLMIAGCGESESTRREVAGVITFDGKPVEQGEILFIPADGQGPTDAGSIVDGKFTCKVAEGKKRVEITATRESTHPAADGLPNYVRYIPKCYNSESTLTAEVNASGDTDLTFDLKPKGTSP